MKWYLKYLKVIAFTITIVSFALIGMGVILFSAWSFLGPAWGTIVGLTVTIALMPLLFKGMDWLWDKWFKEKI